MDPIRITIVRDKISRSDLAGIAGNQFGDMVKAVVDPARMVMAIGGELHSDEEALLIEDGSHQWELWGINLYPGEQGEGFVEFDSMINVRPGQGNRSRGVEDAGLRARILEVVQKLVRDA
jgi:hypothetical protein